jgi:glycosyltransferase involved in cell wall biosynthesis
MHVWLIKDGETLPLDFSQRKMRTWLIAEALVNAGHSVIWWTSTHNHQKKQNEFYEDKEVRINNLFKLKFLFAGSYKKNLSLQRYIHHLRFAISLQKNISKEQKPDIIVCSFPLIESTYVMVQYAKRNNIPIIIDVRDPWPDIIFIHLPPILRIIFYPISKILNYLTTKSFIDCNAIISCSNGYLSWALKKLKYNSSKVNKVFYLGCENNNNLKLDSNVSFKYRDLIAKIKNKFTVFFVGTFGYTYDLDVIIRAAKILDKMKNKNIHFILAGYGSKFTKIYNETQNLENISLTGWIDQNDINYFSSIVDIGIIPMNQINGCLPNKFFDYSCSGLPILSSLEGDSEYLLNKFQFGFTFKKSDEYDLIEKILFYLKNYEIKNTHSYNSANTFIKHFNSNIIYNDFVKFLHEFKIKS